MLSAELEMGLDPKTQAHPSDPVSDISVQFFFVCFCLVWFWGEEGFLVLVFLGGGVW